MRFLPNKMSGRDSGNTPQNAEKSSEELLAREFQPPGADEGDSALNPITNSYTYQDSKLEAGPSILEHLEALQQKNGGVMRVVENPINVYHQESLEVSLFQSWMLS